MLIATTLSTIVNARLAARLRQRLRLHAGGVVALEIGGSRLCFRIASDGRFQPLSPLVEADAVMRWQPAAGKYFHVAGDAALLREVSEALQEALPQWYELPGGENGIAANGLRRLCRKFSHCRSQLAPTAAAVNDFNSRVRKFERRCRKLAQTVAARDAAHD